MLAMIDDAEESVAGEWFIVDLCVITVSSVVPIGLDIICNFSSNWIIWIIFLNCGKFCRVSHGDLKRGFTENQTTRSKGKQACVLFHGSLS